MESFYMMDIDKRVLYKSMYTWTKEVFSRKIKILVLYLIVLIALLLILSFNFQSKIIVFIIFIVCVSRVILNLKYLSLYHFYSFSGTIELTDIISILVKMCTTIRFERSIYKVTTDRIISKLNDINLRWIMDPINAGGATLNTHQSLIEEYWENLGLTDKDVLNRTGKIIMQAKLPTKPSTVQEYAFDVRTHCGTSAIITRYADNWTHSDMTDKMHVKSLKKRILTKVEKYNPTTMILFCHKIARSYCNKQTDKLTYDDAIYRALATKGTAGQFAKQSMIEEVWKDKLNDTSIKFWQNLISNAYKNVCYVPKIPNSFVQYMLYRKMEPLEVSNGEIKITRLMNAPNLAGRVADSKVFTPFNDMLKNNRFSIGPKIGMNIFIELKQLLIYNPKKISIAADFSDFDGSQTPHQMLAVAIARLKNMQFNNVPIEEIAYIYPRYMAHIHRSVKSTFGIEYEIIGQQASGDITTTDDNSVRSSAFNEMWTERIIENIKRSNMANNDLLMEIDDASSGDDILKTLNAEILSVIQVEQLAYELANDLGWKIKDGSFEIFPMLQDGQAKFLSHGVSRRKFNSSKTGIQLVIPVVTRDIHRLAGKWTLASEIPNDLNRTTMPKLTSKYLTAAMVSLGNPLAIASSLYMLIFLRSTSSEYAGSYNWLDIKAKTIDSLYLHNMITLQTGIIGDPYQIDTIVLDTDEIQDIQRQLENIDILVKNYTYTNKLLRGNNFNFSSTLEGNQWNYSESINLLQRLFMQLEKNSQLSGNDKTSDRWWITDNYNNKIKNNKSKLALSCSHVAVQKPVIKFDINLKVKCLKCYQNDIETQFSGINIGIDWYQNPKTVNNKLLDSTETEK